MSKSITQDMAYRQSLMRYAEKYGVSRASRKYNKSRSYIYFWKARWDGTVQSLVCQSPAAPQPSNQHTEAELKLIRICAAAIQTWAWWSCGTGCGSGAIPAAQRACSVFCANWGCFLRQRRKRTYRPKPYEQMTYPGQRVQVDVKVVPRRCIPNYELRLFQYTAIDEFTRLRFLAAYPEQSTYSSADFLKKLQKVVCPPGHPGGVRPDGQRI